MRRPGPRGQKKLKESFGSSSVQALLEVTSVVRGKRDLKSALATIVQTVAEALEFKTVVLNLYRPEFDDSGTYAEESLRSAEPDFELWDVGHAALAAAAAHLGIAVSEFLYARVDVIGGRRDPRLLELELVEPSLGWRQIGDADRARQQREFAIGLESALDRLGLGPFSHRRP